MKTVILLPVYIADQENLAMTEAFFVSLAVYTKKGDYDIVVIDNGSTTEAGEMLRRVADVYFVNEQPLGYAKSVNIGMDIVRQLAPFKEWGDNPRVVVVNNDIEFIQPWLEKLNEAYDTVGGLLSAQDTQQHSDIFYPDESWYSLWMIDMRTWNRVGVLDSEKLNYRFHDQDYSIRLKKAGKFIGRTGLVQVKHGNSKTYEKMKRNEDPEEREEMIRRHGYPLFTDWMKAHHVSPTRK